MVNEVKVTATAPVNIAVIKYWGKRDEQLILPVNSSLSLTLHQDTLRSKTQIVASKQFQQDTMILNGKEVAISENKRLAKVLEIIRERSKDVSNEAGEIIISKEEWPEFRLRIESENNFPTAAGLASSASGFACMTAALTALYNVQENYPGEFSLFARQGSGSACRSMYGGFAKWIKGENADGSDSIALQVSNDNHWDDMRVLILVANSGPKEIGSTEGMQRSVVTSPLLKFRADHLVDERMHVMEKAILEKDFETFAKLTMQDSNQFHAVCMDTYPPVFYLNDTSKAIIQLVHQINEQAGFSKAAYTFDAGPNAVIFTLKEHLSEVMSTILRMTPEGLSVYDPMNLVEENSFNAHGKDDLKSGKPVLHGVEKVMVTKGGPGPKVSWSCQ